MPSGQTIRGSHVHQARAWVDERAGEGAFNELARERDPRWPSEVFARSPYEVWPLVHAVETVAVRLGVDPEDAFTQISAANARADLSSIYRAFLTLATPVMLLSATPRLWSLYVDFGGGRKLVNKPGHYIGQCFDFPAALSPWAAGAWMGFLCEGLQMAGAKNPRARVYDRVLEGDASTQLCEIHYDPR